MRDLRSPRTPASSSVIAEGSLNLGSILRGLYMYLVQRVKQCGAEKRDELHKSDWPAVTKASEVTSCHNVSRRLTITRRPQNFFTFTN